MQPCLSQTLTLPSKFPEDLRAFAAAGCRSAEVWLTKLEAALQTQSADRVKGQMRDAGLSLSVASYQGGLLLAQGEQRRATFDHYQRRLGLCQELGMGTLLVVADFVDQPDDAALERAQVSLIQAAELAQTYGVRLALEFRGKASWCSSLDTAAALVAGCQQPNLGLCFDVFHYYTGPSKFEDLALLSPANLFHVQLCDLAGVPRELAGDADRILPGEGDFMLEPIVAHVRRCGYAGTVAVEAPNPHFWQLPPLQIADAALTSLRRMLGQEDGRRGSA
jgi:sugar phosphate isomerase/epimerase